MEPKDTIPDGPAEPPVQVEAQVQAVEPSAPAPVVAPATEPVVGPVPVAEPVVEPAPAPVAESGAPATPGKSRPRGRTTLLIAAAAVLGIAGGTAVGYGVQADRAPTPLPALSQPNLAYPAKALPADKVPDPLPVSQDRQRKTEGDLRELLVSKPSGARRPVFPLQENGWRSLDEYATEFKSEDYMFETLAEADIRRIAAVNWSQGQYRDVSIRLVQFRSGAELGASDHANGQLGYMPYAKDGAGNEGDPIKGSGNGRYFVYKAVNKPGYLPVHLARAIAQRGDVMLDIHIFDTAPISKKDIRTLAERQLERL
ncbi:hypothetical protein OHA33_18975 [Streptomyces sp. NBC_00562]|uniref:hypothetical protein n=1 Tax=Streptomyces sp. NBC_00562 TaxID=2975777 RepID=UPI002E80F532|nr:hypothetical protein [Streptomyces sp. NBC_00562]WUC20785.1 hypothetical protein OHA33_18975 [Streptomyces sp. NBC_00562]